MKQYEIHPICKMFPEMSEDQFQALKEDIRLNGIHEFGLLYEGMVLDGRHRYRACLELGIEMTFGEHDPNCEDDKDFDPVQYVTSKNLHRRHLTKSQWSMIGADLKGYYDQEAKERMSEGGKKGGESKGREKVPTPSDPTRSRDAAGKAVGVSGKLIDHATTVKKLGAPELNQMVLNKQISVTKAAEIAKGVKCPDEQLELANQEIEAKKEKKKPKAKSETEKPENFNSLIHAWRATGDKFQAVLRLAQLLPPGDQQRLKDSI